jgi:hypothetical protein
MTRDFLASEFGDMVRANTPLGFVGKPEDIASAQDKYFLKVKIVFSV